MIEQFSRETFEAALPRNKKTHKPLWEPLGLREGEYCYYIPFDHETGIFIRSSIRADGHAARTGEDSIRAWLVKKEFLSPLGSKVNKYITRLPGWEERLIDTLRVLWGWRKEAGNCPCGKPRGIFKVKKEGESKGKLFASCPVCKEDFVWMTNGG